MASLSKSGGFTVFNYDNIYKTKPVDKKTAIITSRKKKRPNSQSASLGYK